MVEAAAAKKSAKEGEEDLSMEEILQSIRSIIAEDGEETKEPVNAEAAPAKAPNGAAEATAPGSDVLELTEMVKEDGTVEKVTDTAAPPAEAKKEPPAGDVLSKIDEALAESKPAAASAVAAPAAPAAPVAPAASPPAAEKPAAEALLSEQAAAAAAASLKKLNVEEPLPPLQTTPSPQFRSGATVEDMAQQMLRPMIKEWLDANLPAVVERLVQIEVKKLSRK